MYTTFFELERALYPFQKKGMEYALKHHYSMNGCKMGLGKTIQAISLIMRVGKNAVIVCPAYLKRNWESELAKFSTDCYTGKITIYSYDSFQKRVEDINHSVDILVFDEAHYLKNMKAKRTIFTHKYVKKNPPEYLLLLSGTPIKNRVTEFYSLMKLCSMNPKNTSGIPLTKGFHVFCNYLCNVEHVRTPYGKAVKYSGLKNKPLLIKYLRGKYYRAPEDAIKLPPIVRQKLEIDYRIDPQLSKALQEDFENNHISTAKMNIALAKAQFTAAYVINAIESEDMPVLVFSDHVDSCKGIDEHIKRGSKKLSTAIVTGATPTAVRQHYVNEFQTGKIDVLIGTIGAMSTGFTLTATNRVVFNDLNWCPSDNEQAEKRIHRIGQNKTCFVVHILADGVDKKIVNTLTEKKEVLDEVYK